MNQSLVVIEWILQCFLFEDLVVRHDSYKIGQALAFARTSHHPLRTHAATQYVM